MIPPIARRFVAGETPAEAVAHARALNARNVKAILNLLGEHYEERAPADADADAYVDLLRDLETAGVDACVSVKPSQMGLGVDESVFRENVGRVVAAAAERDRFVWLDMEDHPTVDATLDAYESLAREHGGGVGVCVQANLKRTPEDLARLADLPGKVRLVKGAYSPPRAVAYRERARVDRAYEECLEYLFETFADGVAVGSHDPRMVALARDLHEEYGTPFEVQMLMGVREDAQFELARDCEVWQYTPYGGRWFSYFYRRVLERKENLLFALRAVVDR